MYCRNCGKEINDNLTQCPYCSTPIVAGQTEIDSGSIWWGVLGCCIPIVGLVLYIVWRDVKPESAKKAGIGALTGFVVTVVIPILLYFFIIVAAIGAASVIY